MVNIPHCSTNLQMQMRRCHDCDMWLPFEAFSKNKADLCGLQRRCRDCQSVRHAAIKERNPEAFLARKRKNRLDTIERRRESNRKYQKKNPALGAAKTSKYRANKLKATPSWTNLLDLKQVYMQCPSGMEVDHIVPLRGKTVCGLHVPWNLRYVTKHENCVKSNRLCEEIVYAVQIS